MHYLYGCVSVPMSPKGRKVDSSSDILLVMQEIIDRLEKLKVAIKLADKKKKIEELEHEVGKPDLWSDPNEARRITQELADLKREASEIEELSETLQILKEVPDD